MQDLFKAISDKPISKKKKTRNLESELFGDKTPTELVDAFEQQLGYPTPEKKETVRYKTKLFNINHELDKELLGQLLNDKDRYSIVMWKDTWTVHGDFKIFVIYSDKVEATSPTTPDLESDNSDE